jgi:ATP-dependent DNA helicase RecG
VAGALFFIKQPQNFLPHAYITALRIPGTTIDVDPSDRKQLTGTLRTILEDALRFLNIHLPTPHKIQGMEPEVKLELPPEALREGLVNACAHRDYTIPSPIRLLIYDDRVEIRSPGQLPNSITLEALPLGIHVLRNPIIYNVFLRMGLVTDAGSGIPRIIARVRKFTNQSPVWKLEGNEFVLVLPRPVTH